MLSRTVITKPLRSRLLYQSRHYASTVNLESTLVQPNSHGTAEPLIILHGLLGSKRNWDSLAKAFVNPLGRPVYLLDLRNHGQSPHASPMDYQTMADDVVNFVRNNMDATKKVSVLGHSMGGKVAMAMALGNPELVQNLVVADIAPSPGTMSKQFQSYLDAMHAIQDAGVSSRKEATQILAEYEKDPSIQAFLLTNLEIPSDSPAKFRVPLNIIRDEVHFIGDFPFKPGEATFEGPTLFVKGTKSNYLNERNIPTAEQFFPNMKLKTLEAGHWVHAEKPREFQQLLVEFLNRK